MRRFSASHVCTGEPQPLLDFARQRVLECVGVRVETLAVRVRRIPRTQHAKRDFGWCEVGLCLFDNTPQRLERFALPIDHGPHARVEGHTAEVLEPGHPHAFEVAVERSGETFSRLVD